MSRCNLEVSARTFRTCWLAITSYHIFNASFLAVMGWSHLFTASDAVYENMWLIQISQPTLRTAGYSYAVLSSIHWINIVVNVVQSVRRRRLSFGYDACDEVESKTAGRIHGKTMNQSCCSSGAWETMRRIVVVPLAVWEKYFGMYGWFGVHGAFFYIGFYFRQTVEIVLQTYQAYMISRSISSVWINQFVASMIVINCLYTPFLSTIITRHVALRRILNLTLDIWLDFAIAVVVPIVSMVPSLHQFDWTTHAFPLELVFNDVWITTGVMTARQTMVQNPIDYMSSMLPHLTGLVGLDTIKRIIQRAPSHREKQASQAGSTVRNLLKRMKLGVNSVSPSSFKEMLKSRTVHLDEQRHRKITWAFHTFTVGWAIAVIAVHITSAKTSASVSSCKLSVNAWLAEKKACAVANINCHQLGATGSREDTGSILNDFERASLVRVVFSHCPSLHIPDAISWFPNVMGITTFNSTLIDWPASGAVTAKLTPNLLTVNFVDTNFTESIPAGILHRQLPANTALAIYGSNLTELPSVIGVEWYFRVFPTLVIEYTNIKEVPTSFQNVLAYRLSLGRNRIEELPENIFQYQMIQRLRLSGNPLTKLPAMMGNTAILTRVWIEEGTNVSDVPASWTQWWSRVKTSGPPDLSFSLHGSPACEATPEVDYCQPAPDFWRDEFPYEAIAAQYRLH